MTSFFDHFENINHDKCSKKRKFIIHILVNGNNHVCDFSIACENLQTPFDLIDAHIHIKALHY
jgi:hypothetical protein